MTDGDCGSLRQIAFMRVAHKPAISAAVCARRMTSNRTVRVQHWGKAMVCHSVIKIYNQAHTTPPFFLCLSVVKGSVYMEERPACNTWSYVFLLLGICQQALGQFKVFTVNCFDDHSSAATVLQYIPLRFLYQKSYENVGH